MFLIQPKQLRIHWQIFSIELTPSLLQVTNGTSKKNTQTSHPIPATTSRVHGGCFSCRRGGMLMADNQLRSITKDMFVPHIDVVIRTFDGGSRRELDHS